MQCNKGIHFKNVLKFMWHYVQNWIALNNSSNRCESLKMTLYGLKYVTTTENTQRKRLRRATQRWILEKSALTELTWLESNGRFLWAQQWIFAYYTRRRISWPAEQPPIFKKCPVPWNYVKYVRLNVAENSHVTDLPYGVKIIPKGY
jgi:hypothetical protein